MNLAFGDLCIGGITQGVNAFEWSIGFKCIGGITQGVNAFGLSFGFIWIFFSGYEMEPDL